VVTHALDGQADQLKERLIGERIFARPPDYDTGQDAIVRVKANEVRRRLAQYYDLNPHSPLRIELPAGSYAPNFHHLSEGLHEDGAGRSPEAATPSSKAPERSAATRRWAWAAVLGVAGLTVAAILVAIPSHRGGDFGAFWEPLLSGTERVLICIPTPETFRIYGADRGRLIESLRPLAPGAVRPPLDVSKLTAIIVPEPNLSVGLGDARSLALIHSFVQGRGMTPQIRLSAETTFTEMRANNTLLLGGFTNRWTRELTKDLRFTFHNAGELHAIRDNVKNEVLCKKPNSWEPPGTQDCAMVARLTNSKAGRPVWITAGLDHYGTFAVGEIVTRPEILSAALATLPQGWADRNLQMIFQVEVVRDNIGPPKLIAAHVW
jgi:hypothetical protein